MTEGRSRLRRWVAVSWRPLLALGVAGLAAYWLLGLGPLYQSREIEDAVLDVPAVRPPAPGVGGWSPRPRPAAVAPGCQPQADRTCLQGDAWWVDSCGNPHEVAQQCELAPCENGECVPGDPECVGAPTGWRCEGDVARGCSAGRAYAIDCGADGRRCVMTQEGPACREPRPDDCPQPSGTTRCDGPELVACVDGRQERFDCRSVGAQCLPGRGGRGFRCVRVAPAAEDSCGPCGCPPSVDTEETCNGKDDDGDGFIDENVDCGVVDILAFVVTDDGQGSYTQEDLEAELARVNEAFARDDEYGLEFRLADVIALDREDWLEVDEAEIQEILLSGVLRPQREAPYLPILFTDVVLVEGVPRPGLATPPNGICGGQRRIRSPQPAVGGIIIAKRRWGTTAAHELGHFLGLCHTHMPAVDAVEIYEGEGDPEDAQACQEPCAWEGDGVCDTPEDPGPELCGVDPTCSIRCQTGAVPEPSNIMGYYPSCRSLFTVEQALVMRHALSLRRGWHPCLGEEGCACEPAVGQCPEQMSCRQYEGAQGQVWRCGLDGAVVPGGPCRGSAECGGGSTCVQALSGETRCVRPCVVGETACECRDVAGVEVPLCVEDLRG